MGEKRGSEPKLEYESPELVEYGSIEELTRAGGKGRADGDGFSGLDDL